MRSTTLLLGVVCSAFVLSGCGQSSNQTITPKQDLEFKELAPPSIVLNGRWSAVWGDPVAGWSEKFTMDLRQEGNEVKGTAAFVDSRHTKAVVSGQISSNKIHLVMKPDSPDLHETSWTGTVSDDAVKGTWRLHGKPPSGMATTGPWNGSIEKE